MTVKQLQTLLNGMPPDLPVYINLPEFVYPGSTQGHMRELDGAKHINRSSFSPESCDLVAGKSFDW